jgi:DNA-directed RNA polymerase subunit RPC12/RpoP
MTIRNRIFWIRFMIVPIGLILGVVVLGLVLSRSDLVRGLVQSPSIWVRSLIAALLILIMASVFFADRLIRCPRCHHRFGKDVSRTMLSEWEASRINRCPHCRVHLDSLVKPKVRLTG